MKSKPTSYRLSDVCKRLIIAIGMRLGVSQVAVIELAVREKAAKENVNETEKDAE